MNVKTLSINQHEALGDHVICNGLTREIIKKYKALDFKKFIIWTRKWLVPTIKFMYRDIPEAEVLDMDADHSLPNIDEHIHITTGGYVVGIPNQVNWDQTFYNGQNIPFDARWASFYIERDLERENNLFKLINPDNEPYIIVHNRFDLINYSKLRTDLKKIEILQGITDNAFDYLTLLAKAEEIHVCDSGFKHIVESFDIFKQNLFYHNNPPRNNNHYHTSRRKWKEV